MAFNLTKAAKLASQKINLEPQMVLEIDGVETRYSVRTVDKWTRVGDEGLYIGDDWRVGGKTPLENQETLISFDGTTTSIEQQLDPSKGAGSSISSMQVSLVDEGKKITELVSPGIIVDDVLGRRARVYIGLDGTSFPEDYITVFRGIIDEIQAKAGSILLNLGSPDQKKRQTLFTKQTITVTSVAGSEVTFSTTDMGKVYYTADTTAGLTTYFRHGDETIQVDKSGANSFTLTARAALGTTMSADPIIATTEFDTFYKLEGNVIDLALKLMLSDEDQTPYVEDLPIAAVQQINADEYFEQCLFFREDIVERRGVSIGDGCHIVGTVNNTGTMSGVDIYETVIDIQKRDDGTLIKLSSNYDSLTSETMTDATASFLSQYNMMKVGLGMKPDEVDIAQHLYLKRTFLSSFSMRFYMEDEVNMREFIEQELYLPAGAFSIPRKSKASVGLHTGPIPGAQATIITKDDVPKPGSLVVRRGLANNFANTIIYKFELPVGGGDDNYLAGMFETDEDSINRIDVGTRSQVITSKGMRIDLNGLNLAKQAAQRRLNRYRFGAEYIENFPVTYRKGFNLEIGDVFLLVPDGLSLINTKAGDRSPEPKLYEIINKKFDLKTGEIILSIIDTNYDTSKRFANISPASGIKVGISSTKFLIERILPSQYGTAEYLKWTKFLDGGGTVGIRVRSPDFTTRSANTQIKAIVGNEIEVTTDLGFVPQNGDVIEVAHYDQSVVTLPEKSLYAFMKNSVFADGGKQYSQL